MFTISFMAHILGDTDFFLSFFVNFISVAESNFIKVRTHPDQMLRYVRLGHTSQDMVRLSSHDV